MPTKDLRFINITTSTPGTDDWSNPGGAENNDGSPATSSTSLASACWITKINSGSYSNSPENTYYLKLQNTDFKFPAGYRITNLEIRILCQITPSIACAPVLNCLNTITDTNPSASDSVIQFLLSGTLSGNNKAAYTWNSGSYSTQSYSGDPSSYWGLTNFSTTDLNNSNFGLVIQALLTYGFYYGNDPGSCESAALKGMIAKVDDVILRVTYQSNRRRARSAWR